MSGRFRGLRRLVVELPRTLELAYCLAHDPRVPLRNKVALGAGLGLIVTPFVDIPAWIPVIGELDVIALTLVATHLFIAAADASVVTEQEQLIAQRQSRFDTDVEAGRRLATTLSRRFAPRSGDTPATGNGHRPAAGVGANHDHGVQA